MHITLTDRLSCPRCGPSAGLIVLMDEVADRRVVSGSLGCPLCRERYPIAARVADLRITAGDDSSRAKPRARTPAHVEAAVRVAAFLGLNEGSGFVVVDGPDALAVASALPDLAPEYEPVVLIDAADANQAGHQPVSALRVDAGLPMADSMMRGAAYVGGAPASERLTELVRVVRPTSRVLVDGAESAQLDETVRVLESLGAQVRARDDTGVVAVVM